MSDLRELYQETILDHSRNPRNFRKLEGARKAEGFNPLCGDKVDVYVTLSADGAAVKEIAFQGAGCAISTASASVMTEALRGKPRAEADRLFAEFHGMLTGKGAPDPEALGKLAVFARVSDFPMRVKCATLAWHTFQAALKGDKGAVTTE